MISKHEDFKSDFEWEILLVAHVHRLLFFLLCLTLSCIKKCIKFIVQIDCGIKIVSHFQDGSQL